jgi:hypothetical protein
MSADEPRDHIRFRDRRDPHRRCPDRRRRHAKFARAELCRGVSRDWIAVRGDVSPAVATFWSRSGTRAPCCRSATGIATRLARSGQHRANEKGAPGARLSQPPAEAGDQSSSLSSCSA